MNKDLYSKILFEQNNIKIELCINNMYPDKEIDIYLYKDIDISMLYRYVDI